MKKIGIFCGSDISFPFSLIDYINSKQSDVIAELVKVGIQKLEDKTNFDLIFDRVSRDVPMYQSILKTMVLSDVIVINNPFLKCFEDYFFQLSIAKELGFNVPETALIPTKQHPMGTTSDTFKNLIYPLNWSELFDYIGFPMYLRLNMIGTENFTYKVFNPLEFFSAYDISGSKQLVVQKVYDFSSFYRAFVIGKKYVKIFNYDSNKPLVSRYGNESKVLNPSHKREIENLAFKLCNLLNLDFTTVDFGVFEDKIFVVNFYNPAPKIDSVIFSDDDYKWFVFTTGDYLISLVENPKEYIQKSPWFNLFKKF
ncbi:MAG: hypothetical protein N2560_02995 [Ignavibacteria bacterium]|nr:hypothetical protein [Ignavibacteria bacterium]